MVNPIEINSISESKLAASEIAYWGRESCRNILSPEYENIKSINSLDKVDPDINGLIVCGGGKIMDQAKYWKGENPGKKLIVSPSIWGSGAETSPVVVLNKDGGKQIFVDNKYLPDFVYYNNEILTSIPDDLARYACGDVWAHALEGFLSPLANDELKIELSALIKTMIDLPIDKDERWLKISSKATTLQSKSSVGLVHGIAHVIELVLAKSESRLAHHAMLCSILVYPVMQFNLQQNHVVDKFKKYSIDIDAVLTKLKMLFDQSDFNKLVPVIDSNWTSILRDLSTRTNSCLVNKKTIEYFRGYQISE